MFSVLMQRVQEQFEKKLPFVLYRKPKQKSITGIFQDTDELHLISDLTPTGFIFAPFDSFKKPVLILTDEVHIANDFAATHFTAKAKMHFDDSEKEGYKRLVAEAIAKIREDKFQKVVLSRSIAIAVDSEAIDLFQHLLASYESAFCYLWYHPKVGLWLGATPEILLCTNNKQFTTMSLAGTQVFNDASVPSWGEKELQEQALVTNFIKNALEGKVIGLRSAELETIRAGSLLHLRTKLSGLMLSELDEIIKVLHPTPAVCGIPKTATKEFILSNENYDREFYTGFLGELNFKEERQRSSNRKNQENQAYRAIKNTSELFVNLRCMKFDNGVATIYVGGGITGASDPEKEWQETVNKSRTMLKILS